MHCAGKDDGIRGAERIVEAFDGRRLRVADREIRVTVSVGLSTFPDDGDALEDLIRKADAALYEAKKNGRNCYEVHELPMAASAGQLGQS